jgi:ABC-type uncharacterized transport system permease subunit
VAYLWLALLGAIFVGAVFLWVYTVRDLYRRHDLAVFQRALWVVVVIVAPFLGVFVYWALRPRNVR